MHEQFWVSLLNQALAQLCAVCSPLASPRLGFERDGDTSTAIAWTILIRAGERPRKANQAEWSPSKRFPSSPWPIKRRRPTPVGVAGRPLNSLSPAARISKIGSIAPDCEWLGCADSAARLGDGDTGIPGNGPMIRFSKCFQRPHPPSEPRPSS